MPKLDAPSTDKANRASNESSPATSYQTDVCWLDQWVPVMAAPEGVLIMTIREFLQGRRKAEYPVFMKVLNALPRERFDYTPHERSPSAAQIVWTLALETKACSDLIDTGRVNWKPDPLPADPEIILSSFRKLSAELDHRIERLDEEAWQSKSQLLINDQLYREAPLGEFLWYIFFDAIHHRGQLSTYIRPMGGQVPSIYGPSGDDPGS